MEEERQPFPTKSKSKRIRKRKYKQFEERNEQHSFPNFKQKIKIVKRYRRFKIRSLKYRITNLGIYNKSSKILSQSEVRLLSMGKKFIPTPKPIKTFNLTTYLDQYIRNVRLCYYFGRNNKNFNPKFHVRNSSFNPPLIRINIVEQFLSNIRNIPLNPNFASIANNYSRNNMPKSLRKALFSLNNNRHIVINNADKNLGIVVMDKKWNNSECLSHLNNTRDYLKINHDRFINFIFPSLQLKLKQLMNQYSKNELTKFIIKIFK